MLLPLNVTLEKPKFSSVKETYISQQKTNLVSKSSGERKVQNQWTL